MPRSYWTYDPGSGGQKIPPRVQKDVEKRILAVAEKEYQGRYTRLEIRFKAQFCYIDAYTEPVLMDNWPPLSIWSKTSYAQETCHSPRTPGRSPKTGGRI